MSSSSISLTRPSTPTEGFGLPIEIVIAILELAQYDDLILRYKWIKRYTLVCRSWSRYAQELLFRHVALNKGVEQCKAFTKAIASVESRDPGHAAALRNAVRTLAMAVDHQEIYADVLDLCPKLHELHLTLYHASFRANVLQRLAHAPPIQALRVRTYHYIPLFQLLPLFPCVEYLEVNCSSVQDTYLNIPDIPLPCRLRELRYHNLRRNTHGFVDWAISGPTRETLEVLQVICPSFQLSTISNYGLESSLRSLVVQRLHDTDNLSTFHALREFTVQVVLPCHLPHALYTLPTGVVHLVLSVMDQGDAAAVIASLEAYQERSGQALQVLTYNRSYWDASERLEDARMLHDFCVEHGVEFRLMNPPYGHYAGEQVPLERVQSFPRPVPLSSRREQLQGAEMPWLARRRKSLARRLLSAAGRSLGSSVPPIALARP